MANELYVVVYRTGGTSYFAWRRSLAMTRAEAEKVKRECERGGFKAMVVDYQRSLAVGLPETWEAT